MIKVPYTGEYRRESWDVVFGQRLPITVPEAETISGVIEVSVTVGGGVRLTDYNWCRRTR